MWGAWIIACLIAVVGCNGDLVIEVRTHPDVPTKTVELFLGLEKCENCPAIQPKGATRLLAGEVYFRDGDEGFTAPVEGDGSAYFRIQPSDVGSFLKTVVAVSADQDSAAIVFNVDVTSADRWVMQLEPASSSLNVQGDDGKFVQVWHETAAPNASCIAFETWGGGQLSSRTFIVPKNDPDCDDFTDGNGECADLAWQSSVPPSLDELSCTLHDTTDPDKPFCMVGGPFCRDGQPPVSCGPSDYCVPSELCSLCDSATDQSSLRRCTVEALNTPGLIATKMVCQLPVRSAGQFYIPCANSERFTLGAFEPRIPRCDALELASSASVMGGVGPFSDRVTLTTASIGGMRDAELRVKDGSGGCTFEMEWSGEIADNGGAVVVPNSVLSLTPTAVPGSPHRHLVMPLAVEFIKDCATQPSCTVDLSQEIYNCATGTVPPPKTLTFGERPMATNMGVTIDTYIDSTAQTISHGVADSILVQSGSRAAVGLLRFDLSVIAPNTHVTAAILHLASPNSGAGVSFGLYRMNEEWDEDATHQFRIPGQPWWGPGASPPSRGSTPEATVPTTTATSISLNLPASLIEDWINNPNVNHGLAMVTPGANLIVVQSSESGQANLRPMLEVTLAP